MGTIYLTDTIPGDLEYIPGSFQVSPALGEVAFYSQTIAWEGDIGNHSPVLISYQTRVVTESVVTLINTVTVDVGRLTSFDRSTVFIANGYALYLPVLFKEVTL